MKPTNNTRWVIMVGNEKNIMAIKVIKEIPIELNVEQLLEKYQIESSKKNELNALVKKYIKTAE